ncbi:MAG: hypothetical protein A2X86_08160 [Bdellovibrionales bacterium GWA2_49_15]|nr:MAG: hypothetical protein A2X86_08160 [Bdellovibrionales bacterium GWA2_49_15]HAZ13926.1 DNA-binding protein [Bdellovibrionales bacterium]
MELLTIKEASAFLKMKESWIRSAVFKRDIPYIKMGALIRFNKNELHQWLERQTILPRRSSEW